MSGVFRRALMFVTDSKIGRIIRSRRTDRATDQPASNPDSQNQPENVANDVALPAFSQIVVKKHKRATLIDSSSNTFGNECLRLVNIALQTSQTFSLMMNTCATISRYLRKELMGQYPGELFHIIVGENKAFGFAISDGDYFAEIEQEQYRVLIFTTNRSRKVQYNVHDVNTEMVLEWKSDVVKPSTK